jgi:RNA polymerase sigma factor (sigma-70 family)
MNVPARSDAELFSELYPSLRRFAGAVRPPEIDADDLVQDALARTLAVHSLAACDDAGAYLRAAIVRLASNHRRSLGRRGAAYRRLRPVAPSADAYPSDLDDLMRLSPTDRAVLYLRVVDDWSYAEIADALDSTEVAVRARASRARRQLRVALTEEEAADA